jgi:excisionase family DNA binding protein
MTGGLADVTRQAKEQGQCQLERMTISVPEAGKKLGIGRNAAYEAAHRGEIPVIRLGKRLVVPTAAFEKMLAVRTKAQIVAAELERRLRADEPETI